MRRIVPSMVVLFLLAFVPSASAHSESFSGRYLAGSVHIDLGPAEEALGPVDCSVSLPTGELGGTLGGQCFNLSSFTATPHQFMLFAHDNISAHVSIFAGFDNDGDGCVGCTPGVDKAWEGIDFLGGEVSGPGVLAVFVRAVSNDGSEGGPHIATSGTLNGFVFDASPGQPGPCKRGDQGAAGEGSCHEFDDTLPYPYPCLPACTTP